MTSENDLGKVYWYAPDDAEEEWDEFELDVTVCRLVDGRINIVCETFVDGYPYQARFYLEPQNEKQTSTGVWLSGGVNRELLRFSEKQIADDVKKVEAPIKGSMKNFRGKKIDYLGTWQEPGETWVFEVDATIQD